MKKNPIFKFAVREDLKNDEINFLPTRATKWSTGWDVKAAPLDRKPIIFEPNQMVKIPLGFRTFCPEGWWFELKPRSSTFAKKHLHCLYGTIDEDFFGELILACQYISDQLSFPSVFSYIKTKKIEFGEALGQIIPVKRQIMVVEEISNHEYDEIIKTKKTNRGVEGFGSTSK